MNRSRPILAGMALLLCVASPGLAQRSIATERDTLHFELPDLRIMLDTARALYKDLEEDPRVFYSLGFGPPVEVTTADPAYPWNAISPTSDSTVNVIMPGNLREADRAYYNYAVLRMRMVRGQDPDASCDELVEAEHTVLSGYVDGWIVARTLFGGPAFAPMDELAFARDAGLLRPLLAARGDRSIGICASEWAAQHAEEIRDYETWRMAAFPDLAGPEIIPSEPAADATGEEPAGI